MASGLIQLHLSINLDLCHTIPINAACAALIVFHTPREVHLMRFVQMTCLLFTLLIIGCSDSKKIVQPTDTVTAESIKKYGTGGGLGKVNTPPAK